MVYVLHFMKKRRFRHLAAAVISVITVITAAAVPFRLSGASDSGKQLEKPEKIYFGNVDGAKSEKPISDYYDAVKSGGNYSYKRLNVGTVTGSAKWKRGAAILYGGNYTDFSLEFDFQFSPSVNGAQQIWVLFGVTDKTAFNAENSAAVAIGADKAAKDTGCNISYIGKSSGSMFKTGESAKYDGTEPHHVKIVLFEGSITVTVDGSITAGKTVDIDYKGGLVGIGTGQKNAVLSNIVISDIVGESKACFGKADENKSVTETELYYDINESDGAVSYLRNDYKANNNWINDTPFINLGNYKSFVLEFDYRYTGNGERYIWLNFGNTQKTVYSKEKGSAYLGLGIKKAESESTKVNGIFTDAVGGGWFDAGNAARHYDLYAGTGSAQHVPP